MLEHLIVPEIPWILTGIAAYFAGSFAVWFGVMRHRNFDEFVLAMLVAGVIFFTVAITVRWLRTDYGPFLTLFEVILSNLFSLGLIYTLVFLFYPAIRSSALIVIPFFLFLGVWLLILPSEAGKLPATYQTFWLWIHVAVGKVFLGICLVAVGLAAILLLRKMVRTDVWLASLPDDHVLDSYVWRFIAVAFVFHSLMLLAGAVWAQDAWGRYWAWDSLETWAFITWLLLGLSLHLKLTYRIPPWSGWLLVMTIFALAFITFFGVPFSSVGPHKGII